MKVKINGKNHKIKPASELTIKEYSLIYNYFLYYDKGLEGPGSLEMLINYISIVTGISYRNVADIDIDSDTIRRLFAYTGQITDLKDMPENTEFYYRKSGKTLYQKSVNWRTLGVRKLLEDRKTDVQIEQMVYLLSIYLSNDYDNDQIEEIYEYLQNYNAIEVLSFVLFFFKKLYVGKKSGKGFLNRLLRKVSTNTVKLSNK